ncbi:MAG: hypothetical protein ACK5NU_04795 [Fusobacterium ulcerans]|uniref:hypothetical protein n=1 Tax=Fusobacterium ulcerans TaxID=861 RepID=UPI003A879D08
MDKLMENLMSYGSLGVFASYFLYNDYKDRENHRQFMVELMRKVDSHGERISALEAEK